jgi:hypothetical protein
MRGVIRAPDTYDPGDGYAYLIDYEDGSAEFGYEQDLRPWDATMEPTWRAAWAHTSCISCGHLLRDHPLTDGARACRRCSIVCEGLTRG